MSFQTYRGRKSTLSACTTDSFSDDDEKENSLEQKLDEEIPIVYEDMIKDFKGLKILDSNNITKRRETIRKSLLDEIAEFDVGYPVPAGVKKRNVEELQNIKLIAKLPDLVPVKLESELKKEPTETLGQVKKQLNRHKTCITPCKKEASFQRSNSQIPRMSSKRASLKSSQSQLCMTHVPTKVEERIRERHRKNEMDKVKSSSLVNLKKSTCTKGPKELSLSTTSLKKEKQIVTQPISPNLTVNKPRDARPILYHPVQDICERVQVKSVTVPVSPHLVTDYQIQKHNSYMKTLNDQRGEQEEEKRKERELAEKREIAELRKKTVFTANKVPDFIYNNNPSQKKPPSVPNKKLTVPKSPKFSKHLNS